VGGLLQVAQHHGWGADMLIFRGCGEEPNRTRRFYHSGETTDLAFAIEHVLREFPDAAIIMCGVSLGGNVLLKWLGERADTVPSRVRAAVAVSVPFDLERGSRHISHGFARVYERHFLGSLRRKAVEKLKRFPDLFDANALDHANTLYAFDDLVTGPVHGFSDAHDYYTQSSSIRYLHSIRRPTLLLSARDDPFLPADVLGEVSAIARENPFLTVEFTDRGGHVGFVGGVPWRPVDYVERRTGQFLANHLAGAAPARAEIRVSG
jgi:predicted alpha/beta-fold hydrolase